MINLDNPHLRGLEKQEHYLKADQFRMDLIKNIRAGLEYSKGSKKFREDPLRDRRVFSKNSSGTHQRLYKW
jgi:hypothetical protein